MKQQKAFAITLQDLRDGRVHADTTDKFNELLTKVQDTGKGGELILSIKIKPATRGDVDKVTISCATTLKLPKEERGEDIFYITEEQELSRNHPRQGSLELREVTSSTPSKLKEA